MSHDDRWSIPDPSRTIPLNDRHTLHATWAVDTDGTAWPWLMVPMCGTCERDAGPRHIPAHEQLGPLPSRVQAKLRQHRCGADRRDGGRCRTPVARAGLLCGHHTRDLLARELGAKVIGEYER